MVVIRCGQVQNWHACVVSLSFVLFLFAAIAIFLNQISMHLLLFCDRCLRAFLKQMQPPFKQAAPPILSKPAHASRSKNHTRNQQQQQYIIKPSTNNNNSDALAKQVAETEKLYQQLLNDDNDVFRATHTRHGSNNSSNSSSTLGLPMYEYQEMRKLIPKDPITQMYLEQMIEDHLTSSLGAAATLPATITKATTSNLLRKHDTLDTNHEDEDDAYELAITPRDRYMHLQSSNLHMSTTTIMEQQATDADDDDETTAITSVPNSHEQFVQNKMEQLAWIKLEHGPVAAQVFQGMCDLAVAYYAHSCAHVTCQDMCSKAIKMVPLLLQQQQQASAPANTDTEAMLRVANFIHAMCLYKQKEYDSCLHMLRPLLNHFQQDDDNQAVEHDDDDLQFAIWMLLGKVHLAMGKYEDAEQCYTHAWEYQEAQVQDDFEDESRIAMYMSSVYLELGTLYHIRWNHEQKKNEKLLHTSIDMFESAKRIILQQLQAPCTDLIHVCIILMQLYQHKQDTGKALQCAHMAHSHMQTLFTQQQQQHYAVVTWQQHFAIAYAYLLIQGKQNMSLAKQLLMQVLTSEDAIITTLTHAAEQQPLMDDFDNWLPIHLQANDVAQVYQMLGTVYMMERKWHNAQQAYHYAALIHVRFCTTLSQSQQHMSKLVSQMSKLHSIIQEEEQRLMK